MKQYTTISKIPSRQKGTLLLLFVLQLLALNGRAQDTHPHILVTPSDKAIILEKINQHDWAKKVFEEMQNTVRPYVERHQTNPEWILSRYLMNRVPGKRRSRPRTCC